MATFVVNIQHSEATSITTMYIEGTDVRVRTGPGLGYTIIEKLANTTATVLGSAEADGYLWYQISYNNGASSGYVAYDSSYIRVVTYNPDATFEEQINAFPESYRNALRSLHAEFPNWIFIPDGINGSLNDLTLLEAQNMRKQVSFTGHPVSWRSMGPGCFDWNSLNWITTNGGWTGASKEIVSYYLDPRNFLNADDIYQFLMQTSSFSADTINGVRRLIADTFMAKNYYDANDTAYGGDYAQVIMAAANASGVHPYILVAAIRQEQGTAGTSNLISGVYPGYAGYYNFFNIGASGKTSTDVAVNGLIRAQSLGWSTRSASIIGGAIEFKKKYIDIGQDTYFYQDFNVKNIGNLWHQYAQNVADAYSKGRGSKDEFKADKQSALTFKIPVYSDMPSTAVALPPKSNYINNYYLKEMTVSGLTPTFSMFENNYSLYVTGDTAIKVTPIQDTASVVSASSFNLNPGANYVVITVKSESGNYNNYAISVTAAVACRLYVNGSGVPDGGGGGYTPPPVVHTVLKGDTNGDGAITLRDLANVRSHLLGLISLSGDGLKGADTNLDGAITLRDLANVRSHLLGLINLTY